MKIARMLEGKVDLRKPEVIECLQTGEDMVISIEIVKGIAEIEKGIAVVVADLEADLVIGGVDQDLGLEIGIENLTNVPDQRKGEGDQGHVLEIEGNKNKLGLKLKSKINVKN